MIFFGLLDLFYDYPLDFGSIIHPQFFFLYMGYFDSVNDKLKRLENACPKVAKKLPENSFAKALKILDSLTYVYNKLESTHFADTSYYY